MGDRLNGDYNPLHATPQYGRQMGFGGIIMHGVFAYSGVAHEMVRRLTGGAADGLRLISARFSGPVKPGDTVHVEVWAAGPAAGGGGFEDVRWTAQVVGADRLCLTDGRAEIRMKNVASKI